MRSQLFRNLSILAGMAMIASLSTAPAARADITLYANVDGSAISPSSPGSSVGSMGGSPSAPPGMSNPSGGTVFGFTGTFGSNIAVTQGSFTEVQTSTSSKDIGSVLTLTNLDQSHSHTLNVLVVGSGFTGPVAPPDVSVLTKITNLSTLLSGVNTMTLTTFLNTTAAGSVSINLDTDAVQQNTQTVASLSAPFSITQQVSVTLAAGQSIDIQTLSQLTATPEPATVAMALTGLPLLGLGAWARRRRARA